MGLVFDASRFFLGLLMAINMPVPMSLRCWCVLKIVLRVLAILSCSRSPPYL